MALNFAFNKESSICGNYSFADHWNSSCQFIRVICRHFTSTSYQLDWIDGSDAFASQSIIDRIPIYCFIPKLFWSPSLLCRVTVTPVNYPTIVHRVWNGLAKWSATLRFFFTRIYKFSTTSTKELPDHHVSSATSDRQRKALLQQLFTCSLPHRGSFLSCKHLKTAKTILCLLFVFSYQFSFYWLVKDRAFYLKFCLEGIEVPASLGFIFIFYEDDLIKLLAEDLCRMYFST